MKVLYKEKGLSLIKAVLYSELTDSEVLSPKDFNLFNFSENSIEADDLDLAELINKIRLIKKNPKIYSSPNEVKILGELINLGLRHNHPQKIATIAKVIKQSLVNSCTFILNGQTKAAKKLLFWAKQVQGEVRLSGYQMKFRILPYNKNVLYSKYRLKYNTYDLIINQWSKVYPEYNFLFLLPNKSIFGNRFGFKEFKLFKGKLAALGKKIVSSRIANQPQRSNLVSRHVQYVSASVNYVDFYNKIKKRGEWL